MQGWSRNQWLGLIAILIGTAILTGFFIAWVWTTLYMDEMNTGMSFTALAWVIVISLIKVGAVMGFFIVMIIRKNERLRNEGD